MAGAFRTGTGEIRFVWNLILTIALTIVLIVISRLLMILVAQQALIMQGVMPDDAFQTAQAIISESPEGQAIAASLDLLLILLLVYLLVTRIEKHAFRLADLGLNLQRTTLPFILLGLVIGISLFLGSFLFAALLGTLEPALFPDLSQWSLLSSLVISVIFYIINSFWQEVLFRGYLQTKAVEEYGRAVGVTGVTLVFVVFHGLVQSLTLVDILTGLLLFLFIGLLYDQTKSLYLVGIVHAVLNFMPVLFNTRWQGFEAAAVYCIGLVLLGLFVYNSGHRQRSEPNSSTLNMS